MKDNKILYIMLGVIGLCVFLVLASAGILWFSVADSAPWVQNENGYYVRITRVYYLPGSLKDPWQVIGAHAPSFEVIDSYYGYDKKQAYFKGVAIPGSDPSTFQVIQNPVSGDAVSVFFENEKVSDDPGHFEIIAPLLFKDSKHIYWKEKVVSNDPENLAVLEDGDDFYFRDGENVYVNGLLIADADPETFSFSRIFAPYARDAENIFYYEQTIVDADVDSFLVIGSWGNYSGDVNHIYWQGVPIQDADPVTFKLLEEITTCSADSEHVYFMNEILTGADPSDPENAKLQCLLKTPQ